MVAARIIKHLLEVSVMMDVAASIPSTDVVLTMLRKPMVLTTWVVLVKRINLDAVQMA